MIRNEIITALLAMSPVSEANGSIPAAVFGFHFSIAKAFLWSMVGGAVLTVVLLIALHYGMNLIRRVPLFDKILTKLFAYTRRKHGEQFSLRKEIKAGDLERVSKSDRWKIIALFGFVSLPGPFSGVWSASLASVVFGIPIVWSAVAIILGNMVSALFVVLAVTGISLFK